MMEIPFEEYPFKEIIMGRPIQKRWFGPASTPGSQIVVTGVRFADGTTATDAYIVSQTGSSAYVVSNGIKSEICFMVNADGLGALMPSQCYINATPFGGTALPCKTIAQYRVSLFTVPNSVPRRVGDPAVVAATDYSWSTVPATQRGQADLITASSIPGAIVSITPGAAGYGYFTAPAVSFTGGGTGATATATIANGVVTGYILGAPGSGYATGSMTVGAPPAAVTATATGTEAAGVIDSVSVVLGGGYYATAPLVTVTGATTGSGADVTATVSAGVVTGFVINNGGTGYDSPVSVVVAAPPAHSTATASATVSV